MQSTHQQRKAIAIGLFMWLIAAVFYALDYLQHTIPSVLIKPVADSIHGNYVDIATIMSVYFPVYAISQIPAGYLIDRYGLKFSLSAACFTVSLGLLLMLVPSVTAILLGRILIAMGSAFAFIGTLKTISLWLPAKYFPFLVGLTQTLGVIGGLIGQIFINYLITLLGWQKASLSVVIFGMIWSIIILALLKNKKNTASPQQSQQNQIQSIRFSHIIKDKNIWFLAIYAAIMVGVVMGTFAELYDVVLLQQSFPISSQQATHITIFIFIGVGIGAPLHGIIANYFSSQRTWVIICALMTLCIFTLMPLSLLWSFNTTTLIVLYFLLGFFVSSMMLVFALAKCCYPNHIHGTIFAFVNMIIGLAGFLFPALFAELEKLTAKNITLDNELLLPLFLLILPLLMSTVLTFFIRKDRKPKTSHNMA